MELESDLFSFCLGSWKNGSNGVSIRRRSFLMSVRKILHFLNKVLLYSWNSLLMFLLSYSLV